MGLFALGLVGLKDQDLRLIIRLGVDAQNGGGLVAHIDRTATLSKQTARK